MQRDLAPHGDFAFNLRELGGAMGEFGTLCPLAIGLIAICKMDPSSLFVMLSLTNIVTGLGLPAADAADATAGAFASTFPLVPMWYTNSRYSPHVLDAFQGGL